MSTEPTSDDRDIAELLRRLEQGRAMPRASRAEILRDVCAHYDRVVAGESVDVEILRPVDTSSPQRTGTGRRVALGAAAALLVATLGIAALARGEPRETVTSTVTADGAGEAAEVELAGVRFDLPSGIDVVASDDETLLLGRASGTGVRDSIVVVDLGGLDFESRLDELVFDRLLSTSGSSTDVDGTLVPRNVVGMTDQAIDTSGCGAGAGCLELVEGVGSTEMSVGLRVVSVEVTTSDGRSVVFLTNEDGPLRAAFSELLATASVP